MSDPHRPEGFDPARTEPTAPSADAGYPRYVDPAYAGQLPTYGSGYPPSSASNPTTQRSRQPWVPGPPPGGPVAGGEGDPPEPPQSPRWLFLLAGVAVLLVVGLVIALIIANGSAKQPTAVSPLPTMPSSVPPTPAPTITRPPLPTTSTAPTAVPPPIEPTTPGAAHTVIYSVTGTGRAISIAYIDTGGVLQTEFNVVLPWSKEVGLTSPSATSASVTVVNIGEQITCSVSVDGAQVRQRTGTILTICAAAG